MSACKKKTMSPRPARSEWSLFRTNRTNRQWLGSSLNRIVKPVLNEFGGSFQFNLCLSFLNRFELGLGWLLLEASFFFSVFLPLKEASQRSFLSSLSLSLSLSLSVFLDVIFIIIIIIIISACSYIAHAPARESVAVCFCHVSSIDCVELEVSIFIFIFIFMRVCVCSKHRFLSPSLLLFIGIGLHWIGLNEDRNRDL